MTAAPDLARTYGMRLEDVEDVLAGKETATEVAQRLGLAPVVAEALVGHRKVKKGK